jgi:hypothetical protein
VARRATGTTEDASEKPPALKKKPSDADLPRSDVPQHAAGHPSLLLPLAPGVVDALFADMEAMNQDDMSADRFSTSLGTSLVDAT